VALFFYSIESYAFSEIPGEVVKALFFSSTKERVEWNEICGRCDLDTLPPCDGHQELISRIHAQAQNIQLCKYTFERTRNRLAEFSRAATKIVKRVVAGTRERSEALAACEG